MFEHFLKLFTEEPEKLKKAFIKCLNLFNSLLFSFWIYKKFISNFFFLDFKDYPRILDFISSGKVLIALFTFSVAYYILDFSVSLIIAVVTLFLNWASRGVQLDGGEIDFLFKMFDVVEYKEKENKIIKGKNFDLMYQIFKELNQESTINEIRDYISFRYKPILVSSALIYFFILPNNLHNVYLNWSVPIITLIIILLEIFIEKVFEYIVQNRSAFTSGFDLILVNYTINEVLERMPNIVEDIKLSVSPRRGIVFSIDSNSYRILCVSKLARYSIAECWEWLHSMSEEAPENIFALTKEFFDELKKDSNFHIIKNQMVVFDSIENLKDETYKCIKSLNANKTPETIG